VRVARHDFNYYERRLVALGIYLEEIRLIWAKAQRLSGLETPEESLCIVATELFILCLAKVQRPDDWSGVDVCLIIDPLFVRAGKSGITNKDYVLAWLLLQ
jgi:hypothetical protein